MRVFLIAGEPSGDKLGGALMAALARLVPRIAFDGVGGPMMATEGLSSRFPMDELSVMGIAEVLPRYRQLTRRIAETAAAVVETRPDVLVTIDSPDFCLRVAKKVRASDPSIRVVHYVAPSVWAWRPGRAAKMARHVDQVLALLPFEPPFFEAVGLRCDFVGHPIAAEEQAGPEEVAAFRRGAGLGSAGRGRGGLAGRSIRSRPAGHGPRACPDGQAGGLRERHRGACRLGDRVAGTRRRRHADGRGL